MATRKKHSRRPNEAILLRDVPIREIQFTILAMHDEEEIVIIDISRRRAVRRDQEVV